MRWFMKKLAYKIFKMCGGCSTLEDFLVRESLLWGSIYGGGIGERDVDPDFSGWECSVTGTNNELEGKYTQSLIVEEEEKK